MTGEGNFVRCSASDPGAEFGLAAVAPILIGIEIADHAVELGAEVGKLGGAEAAHSPLVLLEDAWQDSVKRRLAGGREIEPNAASIMGVAAPRHQVFSHHAVERA